MTSRLRIPITVFTAALYLFLDCTHCLYWCLVISSHFLDEYESIPLVYFNISFTTTGLLRIFEGIVI